MLYTEGLFTLAAIFMLFVFIVGCCVLLEEAKVEEVVVLEPEVEPPREVLDFSIMLDWYPNSMHAFLYTAIDKGFFKDEDLRVEIKSPVLTYDAISMPMEKEVDAGIYYMEDVIAAAANTNAPAVSFGAVVQGDLNVVISLAESGIETPADLELKRIGFARSALSESAIIAMMDYVGASVRECEFVDVGFDLMDALISGQVDATIGNFINHDVPFLENKGYKVNYFYPTDFGCPNHHELVFISHKDNIITNPDKYRRFLIGCKRGFEYVKQNPEEALQIILDHQMDISSQDEMGNTIENVKLVPEVEKQSLELLLPAMELVEGTFFQQEGRIWQDSADWMYENKILDERVSVSNLLVNLFDIPDLSNEANTDGENNSEQAPEDIANQMLDEDPDKPYDPDDM